MGDDQVPEQLEEIMSTLRIGEEIEISGQSHLFTDSRTEKFYPDIPSNETISFFVRLVWYKDPPNEGRLQPRERIKEAIRWKEIGNQFFKKGNFKQAQSKYWHSIDLISGLHPIRYKLYHGIGLDRREIAEQFFSPVVDNKGNILPKEYQLAQLKCRVDNYNNLAACNLKLGEFKEARERCEDAMLFAPDNPKTHYRKGFAHFGEGDTEGAIGCFKQTYKLLPSPDIEMLIRTTESYEKRETEKSTEKWAQFSKKLQANYARLSLDGFAEKNEDDYIKNQRMYEMEERANQMKLDRKNHSITFQLPEQPQPGGRLPLEPSSFQDYGQAQVPSGKPTISEADDIDREPRGTDNDLTLEEQKPKFCRSPRAGVEEEWEQLFNEDVYYPPS